MIIFTVSFLQPLSKTIGIRLEPWEEKLGVDYVEHGICRDPETVRLLAAGFPDVEVDDDVGHSRPATPDSHRTSFGFHRSGVSSPTKSTGCLCRRRKVSERNSRRESVVGEVNTGATLDTPVSTSSSARGGVGGGGEPSVPIQVITERLTIPNGDLITDSQISDINYL